MTPADRLRLAAILGMLGSEHQGERAAAALQAEAFRRKHGLTWAELINGKTVYLGGNPPWQTTPEPPPWTPPPPPPPPAPEPPRWTPPPAPAATASYDWRPILITLFWGGFGWLGLYFFMLVALHFG